MRLRDRLPYDLRSLIVTLTALIVSCVPPVIRALVILPKVEFPERPATTGTVVSASVVLTGVVVGIIVLVTSWKTIIAYLRRHIGLLGVGGIAAVYGLFYLIDKYQMLIVPLKSVFEWWMWSSIAAIGASVLMSIYLGIGWRVKNGAGEAGQQRAGE